MIIFSYRNISILSEVELKSVSKMLEYLEQTGGKMERRIKSLWIENQRGYTYNSSMGSYVYPTS